MKFDRAYLEKIEEETLATYAVHASRSKGRKYPENEPLYRTCFQRDRDRVLHTTSFRRLEYKTQVFINYEGDYYRTRLTHTLEVAQIGRTIARAMGANEDLVETICMAHDLGHPPFGHSGETTLNQLMEGYGGFNHNHQSYRIVTELEHRYAQFPGLNLSWEVLEGIVKHETEYDKTDALDYDPHLRGHLEAQITNVADELAYTAHDLTRHSIIRELIGLEVDSMISESNERLQRSGVKTLADLQSHAQNVVGFDDVMRARNRELKDFLYKNMYRHYRVVRMQKKAERILSELFHAYVSEPNMLPIHFQDQLEIKGKEKTICDYLAGMTDRFAVDEYQKLFDPSLLP